MTDHPRTAAPGHGQLRTDSTVPHSARFWNYLLGGKDHFTVDREVADVVLGHMPELRDIALADRAFLVRAVRFLAGEMGIRQFLDIGTGLPTANNTHEVAQAVAPQCRVVYVDNDPVVLTHARALLTSTPEGVTEYVDADFRDLATILQAAQKTLDFSRPIAVMMLGLLEYVPDADDPHTLVARLLQAVPSGSHLVIAHGTVGFNSQGADEAVKAWHTRGAAPLTLRSAQDIERFFDGLELLEPGLVPCSQWRSDVDADSHARVSKLGAVGRKP
jgi:O-methyltransferase involved in polyketide biosynthesis